jgi:Family of unknown function (DUF5719)
VSPAHSAGQRRWLVIVVVIAVIAGVALAARSPGKGATGGPPVAPASLAGTADAESSAWYCTGQTTAAGQLAPGSVVLTNTGARRVSGTIQAVTETGAKVESSVSVPARGQSVAAIAPPKTGTWLSEAVMLNGGGVAVSETAHGPTGWTEAPCQSSTSQQWYFATGDTTGSNSLYLALFNPTSTPDVVDVSFTTPKGVVHPINFQGLVVQSDDTMVEAVSPYVQEQSNVAATVVTRTGRLVASELQLFSGSTTGLALVPGSPFAERDWTIPQSQEVDQGSSSIDVFNPGPTTQEVTLRTRLGSGALSPYRARVSADSTWVLSTGTQTRIPKGDPYVTVVHATGGSGVVVGRFVAAPTSSQVPQDGMANAVEGLTASSPSRQWVVPSPGSAANPAVPGAAPAHLAVTNAAGHRETFLVQVLRSGDLRTLATGSIRPAMSFSLSAGILARAGLNPLLITVSADAAVSEDVGPSGNYGVVTMPGIPLARSR